MGSSLRDRGPGGQLSKWGVLLGIVVLVGSCPSGEFS